MRDDVVLRELVVEPFKQQSLCVLAFVNRIGQLSKEGICLVGEIFEKHLVKASVDHDIVERPQSCLLNAEPVAVAMADESLEIAKRDSWRIVQHMPQRVRGTSHDIPRHPHLPSPRTVR